MARVTPHFNADEFDCHSGEAYPPEWIEDRLKPLCVALEAIRAEVGCPIAVISGYRSPAWNERVGGAKRSQHMAGRAADVRAMGASVKALHAAALKLHRAGLIKIGGLGLYRGWIHVDVRDNGGALARWQGHGVGSERAA